jgi:hypothetical protein
MLAHIPIILTAEILTKISGFVYDVALQPTSKITGAFQQPTLAAQVCLDTRTQRLSLICAAKIERTSYSGTVGAE